MDPYDDVDWDSTASESEVEDDSCINVSLQKPTLRDLMLDLKCGSENNGGSLEDKDTSGTSTPTQQSTESAVMTARAYQQEMFEESLKQNIIVAMDTGSGKTQV